MRNLEILMLIVVFIILILLSFKKTRQEKILKYVFILPFLLLILHIRIEHVRYQFCLLYLLVLVFFIYGILLIIKVVSLKKIRFLKVTTLVILIITILLSYAFPVYSMLEPTGNKKIGTITFDVTDHSRKELYSENLNDDRKIKYQIWYPTDDNTEGTQAQWLNEGKPIAKGVAKTMGFPDFMLIQTTLVTSHAYKNVPLSTEVDKYPVIIISHGWTGFHDLHADIAEELTSHGYIVLSIDHTYGSSATVFNDEVIYNDPNILPDRENEHFLDDANQLINTYADDIKFIIDELDKLNQSNPILKDHLNLQQIGVIGHSTGGGAAVKAALTNNRIKTVIGLDAWVEPVDESLLNHGLNIPNLFLRSEEWEESYNNDHLFTLLQQNTTPGMLYQIDGTKHYDFTMAYMYSPLSSFFHVTGALDGQYVAKLNRNLIRHFFDQNLRNKDINWNEITSDYQELKRINYNE